MMMRAIGFRVEPKAVHWSIVEGKKEEPIVIADSVLNAPKTYDEASALSWYREQVLLLSNQYEPMFAAIRYSEPNARNKVTTGTRTRIQIEGVIIEALNSKGLRIVAGASSRLSANIGSKSIKKYISIDGFRGIDWATRTDNRREAILAATAALQD